MKRLIVFFILLQHVLVVAQTSTNSTGSGTYTNTSSWTSPSSLTGTNTIGDGHTITIPSNINQVYSNKINFSGNGKSEADAEAGEVVFTGFEGEAAMVGVEYLADEKQP